MANFKGHVGTAAALGAAGAYAGYHTAILSPDQALTCWGLVIVGGVSPDIDCDYSHSIRFVFNILAGAILVLSSINGYAPQGVAAAVIFRYGFINIFRKFSTHRGIWHSAPMGVFCATMIYGVTKHYDIVAAEYYAISFFCGFLIHLLVDEFFSINFKEFRLKASSGTALKFWPKSPPWSPAQLWECWAYMGLYIGIASIIFYTNKGAWT